MSEAFIGSKFVDGDKDWDAPNWRLVLDNELTDGEAMDFERERDKILYMAENEIGLKHPKTGTTLKLRDDGSIEMFVNEDTGIRLDPAQNAVLIYGDVVHMVAKDVDIHTRPHGFSWNKNLFNPALYYKDSNNPLPQFSATNNTNYSIFSGKARASLYDDKLNSLLNDLGIEVKKR